MSLEGRLGRAIEGAQELRIRYRSRTARGLAPRTVQPLGLATRPSGTYLLASEVSDPASSRRSTPRVAPQALPREVRKYKLARIEDVEPTGRTFEPPVDFDADAVFAGSFGVHGSAPERVVVRFTPKAAPFVRERRWHPSQELTEEPDGSVLLTMHVGGLVEVKAWVQSFGADAAVLEPEALAREVVAEAARVVAVAVRGKARQRLKHGLATPVPHRKRP